MNLETITKELLEHTADPVWFTGRPHPDKNAIVHWVNPAFCAFFGVDREEVVGRDVTFIHLAEDLPEFVDHIVDLETTGQRSFSTETRCRRGDGRSCLVNITLFILPSDDEQGRRTICSLRDVDYLKRREEDAKAALEERKRLYSEIRSAKGRLEAAIDAIVDPIAIYDSDHRLIAWNRAYKSSFAGMTALDRDAVEASLPARPATGQAVAQDTAEQAPVRPGAISETGGGSEIWEPVRLSDGRYFRMQRTTTATGDLVFVRTDVTALIEQQRTLEGYAKDLERANAEITHQALHDDLTGLGNRRKLAQSLTALIGRGTPEDTDVAVLSIDLDRFKQINDTMGHAAGDFVLTTVAGMLREMLDPDQIVARIGGDEFVIVMPYPTGSDAPESLARKIVAKLSQPIVFDGRPCRIGASVGIACTSFVAAEGLLTSSDIALYRAKASGRNCVAIFNRADLDKVRETKALSDDILRGLEHREFIPYFQPQVDAATGRVMALEALVRWQHPDRGILSPNHFLDTAEDLGALAQIDHMVFEKALDACLDQLSGSGISLAFNISNPRLVDPAIHEAARRAISAGFDVTFELLETIYMDEINELVLMQLDALRDSGVSIEIDDFGSGRASIVALQKIAPDRLKIDR